MSALICSQETCLMEEMGLRARPYICGRVTGIAVPVTAVGKQFCFGHPRKAENKIWIKMISRVLFVICGRMS